MERRGWTDGCGSCHEASQAALVGSWARFLDSLEKLNMNIESDWVGALGICIAWHGLWLPYHRTRYIDIHFIAQQTDSGDKLNLYHLKWCFPAPCSTSNYSSTYYPHLMHDIQALSCREYTI